jgi:hypothetical protein
MGGDRTNAERQRRYIARLKAQAAKAGVSNAPDAPGTAKSGVSNALVQELAQAKARIAELEAARETGKGGADVAHWEAEIAALRDENHAFREELAARAYVIKTRDGGGLTKAQYAMLQMLGHPDDPLSEKKKNEAIRLINQLRYVLCNEAELPSMDPRKFHISFQTLWRQRQERIEEAKKKAKRQRRGQPKASPRPPKDLPKA